MNEQVTEDFEETPSPGDTQPTDVAAAESAPPLEEVAEVEAEGVPAEIPPPAERKARRFLRAALRWLLTVLILLGLGAAAALVWVYRPTARKLVDTQAALDQANERIADLKAEISRLETRIEALGVLREENQQLQEELSQANLHVLLLSALADVHAAQFALAIGEVDDARLQLEATPSKLEAIAELAASDQQMAVQAMQQRLALALNELGERTFAAQSDLEVLANELIEWENGLSGGG